MNRRGRQFFKIQVQLKKEGLFDKLVPAWASDMNLLAQVVKLQYAAVRSEYLASAHALATQQAKRQNCVGRAHPITFSWATWEDLGSCSGGGSRLSGRKKARLVEESKQMMAELDVLVAQGRQRKSALAAQQAQQKRK